MKYQLKRHIGVMILSIIATYLIGINGLIEGKYAWYIPAMAGIQIWLVAELLWGVIRIFIINENDV